MLETPTPYDGRIEALEKEIAEIRSRDIALDQELQEPAWVAPAWVAPFDPAAELGPAGRALRRGGAFCFFAS